MKKVMALTTALFMLIGISAFAGGPPKGNVKAKKEDAGKETVKVDKQKKSKHKKGRTIAPQQGNTNGNANGNGKGNKNGWYKNRHNPHNPNSNNPGHGH
jgi:uncharacterized protein YxeA